MADEQDRWLDADAAERLLRGEPLEAVDEGAREQLERLAGVLGALTPKTAPTCDELPGEAAALAAFRKARESGEEVAAPRGRHGLGRPGAHSADAGVVRLGRPVARARRTRWGRPARFGLAAVLTAGMVGGVAVAAGTGALPTPFTHEHPDPAASVTAVRTPDRSPAPAGPTVSPGAGSVVPAPDGATHRPSGDASATGGTGTPSGPPGADAPASAGSTPAWLSRARASCRDVLDGKKVDDDRRRFLEHAAGGGNRVRLYCASLLKQPAANGSAAGGTGGDGRQDDGKGSEQGGRGEQGDQGDDDGHHAGHGGGGGWGGKGVSAPARPGFLRLLPLRPADASPPRPAPKPSVTALR
ncbi:hypothetical protein ACGFS9_18690 [Streptomyces sp. NPDC048566]|uniref:hypothetical protein n=1 Tax=Streptomyces sp. NPDC048566 TaxID=3365569 RepID=UPI00371F7E4E